jgi:hypothetical protein
MANLKAIGRIYLHLPGMSLDRVESKIRTTLTWPIKAL